MGSYPYYMPLKLWLPLLATGAVLGQCIQSSSLAQDEPSKPRFPPIHVTTRPVHECEPPEAEGRGNVGQVERRQDSTRHRGSYSRTSYWPLVQEEGADEFVCHFSERRLLSSDAWTWLPTKMAFNPALAVLPEGLARRLHPKAHYVAAVRHENGQCARLGANNDTVVRERTRLPDSSILLLDKELQPVVDAARLIGTDMRLLATGDRIIVTYVYTPGRTHVRTLDLRMEEGLLLARYAEADHLLDRGARNIGLIARGSTEGPQLLALWWLADSAQEEANDIRPVKDDEGQALLTHMNTSGQGESALGNLHNSINPVELPEEDAYLAIGHRHLAGNGRGALPKYGYKYVHYFVLLGREPPFATKYISPAFCVPAAANAKHCEIVQFISSAVREGDSLLISYGINDCEAATFRVPLSEVLRFTKDRPAEAAGPTASMVQLPETVEVNIRSSSPTM